MELLFKVCTKCRLEKPLSDFYKNCDRKDGHVSICIVCERLRRDSLSYEVRGDLQKDIKRCSACKEIKSLCMFSRNSKSKDGLHSACKLCQHNYYEDHKEEIRVYSAEYYKTNKHLWDARRKQNKDKINARNRKNRELNKEIFVLYDAVYYIEHKDKRKLQAKRWRENNPDKRKLMEQHRRAKKAEVIHDLTEEEWRFILSYYDRCCAYCGKTERENKRQLSQEHIIPVSAGGPYSFNNIVPSCTSCNSHKRNKLLEETDLILRKPQPTKELYLESRKL